MQKGNSVSGIPSYIEQANESPSSLSLFLTPPLRNVQICSQSASLVHFSQTFYANILARTCIHIHITSLFQSFLTYLTLGRHVQLFNKNVFRRHKLVYVCELYNEWTLLTDVEYTGRGKFKIFISSRLPIYCSEFTIS